MNRRTILAGLTAIASGAAGGAAAGMTCVPSKIQIPGPPEIPAESDPWVARYVVGFHSTTLGQFASDLETAIMMTRKYPELVAAGLKGDFPAELRTAYLQEFDREPLTCDLNDEFFEPGYNAQAFAADRRTA
jgi:hypothetical protein